MDLANHLGDLADVVRVVELIVAGDVVRHHQQRPRLCRISDALRIAHDLAALVARQKTKVGIDRLRLAFARAHRVDGEHAISDPQKQNETENDDPAAEGRHAVLDGSESYADAAPS